MNELLLMNRMQMDLLLLTLERPQGIIHQHLKIGHDIGESTRNMNFRLLLAVVNYFSLGLLYMANPGIAVWVVHLCNHYRRTMFKYKHKALTFKLNIFRTLELK